MDALEPSPREAAPPPGRDARLVTGTRRILHLDVDAFLASVEQAVHPELANRPVVVGGPPSSRNLVMSCCYRARRFGIRPGMFLSEAARRCPSAAFRDGDSQAANRLREEVTRILLGYTPRVEVSSIDDFFLDLTGSTRLLGSAFEAAERIREEVAERTRLPLSIGIGTNKLMARLAGKLAKPGGVAEILPGAEETFLAPLPVLQLPGVGHSIGAKLARFSKLRTSAEQKLHGELTLLAHDERHVLRQRSPPPLPYEVGAARQGTDAYLARCVGVLSAPGEPGDDHA